MGIMDNIRYALAHARSAPSALGLRPYTVTVVITAWTGGRPGNGTKTVTTTTLLEGGQNPRVEAVSSREVIASGGKYEDGDLGIGPFTGLYTDPLTGITAGMDIATLDPNVPSGGTLTYLIDGPGLDNAPCRKIDLLRVDPLRIRLILRRTGQGK